MFDDALTGHTAKGYSRPDWKKHLISESPMQQLAEQLVSWIRGQFTKAKAQGMAD
jgi:hypothetical protein